MKATPDRKARASTCRVSAPSTAMRVLQLATSMQDATSIQPVSCWTCLGGRSGSARASDHRRNAPSEPRHAGPRRYQPSARTPNARALPPEEVATCGPEVHSSQPLALVCRHLVSERAETLHRCDDVHDMAARRRVPPSAAQDQSSRWPAPAPSAASTDPFVARPRRDSDPPVAPLSGDGAVEAPVAVR